MLCRQVAECFLKVFSCDKLFELFVASLIATMKLLLRRTLVRPVFLFSPHRVFTHESEFA